MRKFRNCFEFVPYVRNYYNLAQLDGKLCVTQSSCSDASYFLHGIIEQLVEVRHTGKRKKLINSVVFDKLLLHFVAGESALTDRKICYYNIEVKKFKSVSEKWNY